MQSVYLLTPLNEQATDWINENLCLEGWQWQGNSAAIEHRYIGDIVEGMINDGLVNDTDFTVS